MTRLKPKSFEEVFGEWPRQQRLGHALKSWKALNVVSMWLTHGEVAEALAIERANKRRKNMIKRLTQRLAKLDRNNLFNQPL